MAQPSNEVSILASVDMCSKALAIDSECLDCFTCIGWLQSQLDIGIAGSTIHFHRHYAWDSQPCSLGIIKTLDLTSYK